MKDHWFDALHKALIREVSRRSALPAMGLAGILLAGGLPGADAKKNRNKKKRKGHKKYGKKRKKRKGPKTPRPDTCSGGACARAYPYASQETDWEWCEFVCEQCDGADPRDFCIVGDRGLPSGAVCCDEGQTCCSGLCVDTNSEDRHCGACNHRCSPGKICFGGECVCQDGLTLCGNTCRDTARDEFNCGQCGHQCGADEQCVDGDCACEDGRSHCNGRCCPAGQHCLNEEVCCPDEYIGAVCPGDPPGTCRPDMSIVCCDGFACSVGTHSPAGYYCYGHSSNGTCQSYYVEGGYAPLATHTYGT